MPMYDVSSETENEETIGEKSKKTVSKVFDILQFVIIGLAGLVFLYLILLTPHQVDGRSMFPTYIDQQYLLANKLIFKIKNPTYGDVIIFERSETQDYIKRIIALPGDTVSLKDGQYYVNGKLLNEEEYLENVITTEGTYLKEGRIITVPEGEYFVSGDNRPHSTDSRAFGSVKEEVIKGKVWFIIHPFDDFELIKTPTYDSL